MIIIHFILPAEEKGIRSWWCALLQCSLSHLPPPLPTKSRTGHGVASMIPSLHAHPPHQLALLTSISGGSSTSSIGSSSGGVPAQLSKKEQARHSSLESKPRKLVMLQDSPLSQEKLGKMKNRMIDNHHTTAYYRACTAIYRSKEVLSTCAVENLELY